MWWRSKYWHVHHGSSSSSSSHHHFVISFFSTTCRYTNDVKGEPIHGLKTERDVFKALGLEYKAPHERDVWCDDIATNHSKKKKKKKKSTTELACNERIHKCEEVSHWLLSQQHNVSISVNWAMRSQRETTPTGFCCSSTIQSLWTPLGLSLLTTASIVSSFVQVSSSFLGPLLSSWSKKLFSTSWDIAMRSAVLWSSLVDWAAHQ